MGVGVGGFFPNENLAPVERKARTYGTCTDTSGIHAARPAFTPLHGVTQGDNVRRILRVWDKAANPAAHRLVPRIVMDRGGQPARLPLSEVPPNYPTPHTWG